MKDKKYTPSYNQQQNNYQQNNQNTSQQVPPNFNQNNKQKEKTEILAILGFVFSFLFALAGLILSIIGLNKIKKNPKLKGKGLAIAGIIISSIKLLIIPLIIMGAFAYFGVLDPTSMVPDKCVFQTGLECQDFTINPNSMTVQVKNGFGREIVITGFQAILQDGSKCKSSISELPLQNGQNTRITVNEGSCNFGKSKEKVKINTEITYYFKASSAAFSKTIPGEIMTKVS